MSIANEGEPSVTTSTREEIEKQIYALERDPAGHVIDKQRRDELFRERILVMQNQEIPNL